MGPDVDIGGVVGLGAVVGLWVVLGLWVARGADVEVALGADVEALLAIGGGVTGALGAPFPPPSKPWTASLTVLPRWLPAVGLPTLTSTPPTLIAIPPSPIEIGAGGVGVPDACGGDATGVAPAPTGRTSKAAADTADPAPTTNAR